MTIAEQIDQLVSGIPAGTRLVTFPGTKPVELIFSESRGTVLREVRINMGMIEVGGLDKES